MNILFKYPRAFLVLAGVIFFIPFLGYVHLFDWDEINFAECAREMIVTGDYSTVRINYIPFWEKPPLFIWMQVLSMKLFGINEFAARFPNALGGIITLLVLFNAGRKLYDEKMGMLWALLYMGSLLPFMYFRSGIIDPWFNLFIFLGFYYFFLGYIEYRNNRKGNSLFLVAGLFLGLAVMTKGPVAIIISGGAFGIFLFLKKFRIISLQGILLLIIGTALTGGGWFLVEILRGHSHVLADFIEYQVRLFKTQDAGHGGPFFYHFVVLFIGCFPMSIPAIRGHVLKEKQGSFEKDFHTWMLLLLWITLLLFSIVKTKIPHYSSLCYFPLSFLAARFIHKAALQGVFAWKKWMNATILAVGIIIGIALTAVPFVMMNKEKIFTEENVKDPFAYANIQADVHWNGFESLIGLFFLFMLFLGIRYLRKQQIIRGIVALCSGMIITLFISNIVLVPKIEGYSQRTAIEYFKSLKGKDVYVATLGYKSYAHLFYTEVQPCHLENCTTEEFLTRGPIDKPACFISKIQSKKTYLDTYTELELTDEKNGFVFYIRQPSSGRSQD